MSAQANLEELFGRARTTLAYGAALPATATLEQLPVTEKARFRGDPAAFVAPSAGRFTGRYEAAGNADARYVYRTESEHDANAAAVAERWAAQLGKVTPRIVSLVDHNWGSAGPLVERIAQQLGAPLQRAFPYALGDQPYPRIALLIRQMQATVLIATPDELLEMEAQLRRFGGFNETRASVEHVFLIGEPTTAAMRRRLSHAWQANATVGSYGTLETGTIATGCEHGSLHVLEDRFVAELRLLDDVVPLEVDGGGELIVTPLHAEGVVLLRYATGDAVCVQACNCALPGPGLVVAGREQDFVIGPDGEHLGPEPIEELVFDIGRAQDYHPHVDEEGHLTQLDLLRLPDRHVDIAKVQGLLRVPVTVVDALPPVVAAASVIKEWPRVRAGEVPGSRAGVG